MPGQNLQAFLKFWSTRWPDRVAVKCSGKSLTWRMLEGHSDAIAAGLARQGVRKGDRIGILMHNRVEFLEVMFAAFKLGASVTLLNIRFTPSEMVYPILDAAVRLVVADNRLLDTLSDAVLQFPELQIYSTERVADYPSLDDLRDPGGAAPGGEVGADDVALICYTSGTTGFPKGAMLTHGNIREAGLACMIPSGLTFNDRVLISLPLAYTWAACQFLREGLLTGATVTIIEPTGDADKLLDVLIDDQITAWSSVPLLFERITESPRFNKADLSHLRHAVTGGASLHLLQKWQEVGVRLRQAYGMTETAGHATLLFGEDAERQLGSSGRVLVGMDLRIVDEDGNELGAGGIGEIIVRGPMVMKGYINKPKETAETLIDGWLRTGDTGLLNEEGFLYVVDRSKDMLRSGGLNIYPAELERVIAGVQGLEEFAVVGMPHPRWGEVPIIVAHGTQPLDLEALKLRCRKELADYKRPHFIIHHGQPLPRTVSGKILKRNLRDEYTTLPPSAVALKE